MKAFKKVKRIIDQNHIFFNPELCTLTKKKVKKKKTKQRSAIDK